MHALHLRSTSIRLKSTHKRNSEGYVEHLPTPIPSASYTTAFLFTISILFLCTCSFACACHLQPFLRLKTKQALSQHHSNHQDWLIEQTNCKIDCIFPSDLLTFLYLLWNWKFMAPIRKMLIICNQLQGYMLLKCLFGSLHVTLQSEWQILNLYCLQVKFCSWIISN